MRAAEGPVERVSPRFTGSLWQDVYWFLTARVWEPSLLHRVIRERVDLRLGMPKLLKEIITSRNQVSAVPSCKTDLRYRKRYHNSGLHPL